MRTARSINRHARRLIPKRELRGRSGLRGCLPMRSCVQIVQRGALEPPTRSTKSTDVEVQMEVLACLCNHEFVWLHWRPTEKFMDALDVETHIILMFRGYHLQVIAAVR